MLETFLFWSIWFKDFPSLKKKVVSKITIITPFRNASRYIQATANSILSQTHTDWEWILINDNSLENEELILAEFLIDSRVKLTFNKGKGITDALITGFELATGSFVTRMDADDIMPLNKLESMLSFLKYSDADVITGKARYFSDDVEISDGYRKYESWLNDRVNLKDFYTEIYRECTLSSGNWMMSREKFESCGGFAGLTYPEDYDLLFRWYACGMKIEGMDEITHYWREHPQRTSKNSLDYSQEQFFKLKINRFLELDRNTMPLILNGTGRKGRLTASVLIDNRVEFDWVSIEPEKFKAGIYDQKIVGVEKIEYHQPIQILNAAAIDKLVIQQLYEPSNSEIFLYNL